MATFRANLPQSLFIASKARYLGLISGIGGGKTAAGAVKSLLKADSGQPGIVVAPDFPHFAKSTWPEWKKWIPWDRVKNRKLNHPYTKDKRLVFATPRGDVEVFYGGIDEPDSWTGPTVNWAWFDEGRRKDTRDAFDVLAGRIRTGPHPQLFVTTSPRGILHWLYEVFVEKQFNLDPELVAEFELAGVPLCEYYQASTRENAHNLDPLYYASLKSLYTGKYALQELGGEFITLEGAVYESFDRELNVTRQAEYISGVPVVYGVDDGFVADHPRVFLLTQTIPPNVNVFAEYVSTYDFQQAVEDKATVPLYYDARGDKLGVAIGDINERIAAKLTSDERRNTQDNLTALEIVAAELEAGNKSNLSTGTGINP